MKATRQLPVTYSIQIRAGPKDRLLFAASGNAAAAVVRAFPPSQWPPDAALRHVHVCNLVRARGLLQRLVIAHPNEAREAHCHAAVAVWHEAAGGGMHRRQTQVSAAHLQLRAQMGWRAWDWSECSRCTVGVAWLQGLKSASLCNQITGSVHLWTGPRAQLTNYQKPHCTQEGALGATLGSAADQLARGHTWECC